MFCQACNFWQNKADTTPAPTPFLAEELKSEIPFSTKEPEVYQAEIVLINYGKGEKQERKIIAARSGEKFRYDYASKISLLQRNANEEFLLKSEKKFILKLERIPIFPNRKPKICEIF